MPHDQDPTQTTQQDARHKALAAHRATSLWRAMAEKSKAVLAKRRPSLCQILD